MLNGGGLFQLGTQGFFLILSGSGWKMGWGVLREGGDRGEGGGG